jgi:hypothetical protein
MNITSVSTRAISLSEASPLYPGTAMAASSLLPVTEQLHNGWGIIFSSIAFTVTNPAV